MACRFALCVFLLSLLTVCISYPCTIVNDRGYSTLPGIINQVGSYKVMSYGSLHGDLYTFRCWVSVSGSRQGITRRIQIYDYDIYVGACSGSVAINKGSLDERFTLQLCGREKSQSYQDSWDYLNITVPMYSRLNFSVSDVFVNGNPVLGNEVELPVDATWKTLTSFGYPNGYPSFLNFTYVLKSASSRNIEISVLTLDMDGYNSSLHCEDDYIDISDTETRHRWCQGRHNLSSQGPILYITLHTDARGSARGFELRYRETPLLLPASTTLAPTGTTPSKWTYFTVIAKEQSQTLAPSVNQIFESYVDYRWIIQNIKKSASRIKVTFTNVNLGEEVSCSQAKVTLYEGTVDDSNELEVFCGRVTPGVSFWWLSPLTVRLQTHGIAPAHLRGFLLEYQSTAADEVDSCNSTVQVNADATYLTFAARGSGPADSVDCWWKLRAASRSHLSLQIEDLNLQGPGPYGCSDWLQMFNGLSSNAAPVSEKICGSTTGRMASAGETMLVRFHGNSAFSSFRLRVQSYEVSQTPSPGADKGVVESSLPSPWAVIWSTVFCLLGLVLIIVVIVCCCYQRRKRKMRSRRSMQNGSNVMLHLPRGDNVAVETGSDLERQMQSVSVCFISGSVFWNGTYSEPPPPYPGSQQEAVQAGQPPSYASLQSSRDTGVQADLPPPPPYSVM